MATAAQITANQANAQLSTGPKTPAGKSASSRNATRHGLSAATFDVLIHEDQAEFNRLVERFKAEHKPTTLHQTFLVEQLARAWWLLARAHRLEARAYDYIAGAPLNPEDPDAIIVERLYETNPNTLQNFQRHAAQAERSYYRAHRELKASIQAQNEANAAAEPAQAPVQNEPKLSPADSAVNVPVQNEPNSRPADPTSPASAKPSLRSQMPENLALCL